jgi:hypothetical protein
MSEKKIKHINSAISPAEALEKLRLIYQEIDKQVDHLTHINTNRLNCGIGCAGCCIDNLSIYEIEALNIKSNKGAFLIEEQPYPAGSCAFLNSAGHCRIYEHRPYVCRTQGLPLRWYDVYDNDRIIEMRDICPLNDNEQPIQDLPADSCWLIGPVESQLSILQAQYGGGLLKRIALRDLFDIQ